MLSLRLKIDLHVHTVYSDGSGTVGEVLETAEEKGLDGLAITDHETLEGYFEARASDCCLLVLPGFEVETDAGHVLVLGLERLPPVVGKMDYEELIRWARGLGGLTVLAHPAAGRFRLKRWMCSKPDVVEVFNASYPAGYFVRRGLKLVWNPQGSEVRGLPRESHLRVDRGGVALPLLRHVRESSRPRDECGQGREVV